MCLITSKTKAINCKKDKTVYKLMVVQSSGLIVSLYHEMVYNIDQLYKTEFSFIPSRFFYDWTYFDNNVRFWLDKDFPNWREDRSGLICVERGFHSDTTKSRLKQKVRHDEKMFSCIIPSGSIYYIDGHGLTVSNQIIIKSQI